MSLPDKAYLTTWMRQLWRPVRPAEMTERDRFEYEQFLHRVRRFTYIKGAFNLLVLFFLFLLLPLEMCPGPALIILIDGLVLLPYTFLVRRWPALSTYILISTTALAISLADIASGSQTGTYGVLYALLIVVGIVLLVETRTIVIITTLVSFIYILSLALEIFGVIPIEIIPSPRVLTWIAVIHTIAFVCQGVFANMLVRLYGQLAQVRLQYGPLAALREGFQDIREEINLDTLLQRVTERAITTIPAVDRAVLLIQEGEHLTIRGVAGCGDVPLQGMQFPPESIEFLLASSPGLFTDIAELFQRYIPEQAEALRALPPSKAIAFFSLKDEPPRSLLVVASTRDPDAFDASTQQLIELFAHQAAVAIENARLLEQSQSRLQEALALHQIGQEISSRLEMRDLVSTIYRHIQQAIDASHFLLALKESAEDRITLLSPVNSGEIMPDMVFAPRGVLGWVIRHQRPLRCGDVERDLAAYSEIHIERYGSEDVQSILVVPLLLDQQAVGALSVQSPRFHAYGERDEQFLIFLASYVTVAIQNARLYDEVQRKALELQQKQEELRSLIDVVSQQLQRPVEIVSGFSQLLKNDAGDRLDTREQDYLDRIQRNVHWVSRLVQDMAFLARLDQIQEEPESLPLTTLIQGVSTNLNLCEQGVTVNIQEDMPSIYADPVLMWACFYNLLQNAQKLLQGVDSPCIEVGCELLNDGYRIHVRGNGQALPPESLDQIFELFFPIGADVTSSSGIGLTITHQICQRHHGRVWAESTPDQGTTFYIRLPKTSSQYSGGTG